MTVPALLVTNRSGIHSRDWILCPTTCWRSNQHHLIGIPHMYKPLNELWWLQWPEWQRPSRLSLTRWHIERISNSSTCSTRKMRILHMRIWTPVLISRKTKGISTLCCMIPSHPERNHQAMANSPSLHGVLGFLMGPIGTRLGHVGRQIAMNAKIGFNLQVTATLGFHSLYDRWYQTMWLFSGTPDYREDDTVMEKHCTEALNSAVRSSMHPILTEDEEGQQDAANLMVQIAMPWTTRRWSESKLANGTPLTRILKENAHVIDPELNVDEQAELKTLVEWYTSQGASGAWRVHRWWLACFLLVLGDRGLQRRVWTMVQWMATRYLGGFFNFRMAEGDISTNACQRTCGVSRTWRGRQIKRGPPFGTR